MAPRDDDPEKTNPTLSVRSQSQNTLTDSGSSSSSSDPTSPTDVDPLTLVSFAPNDPANPHTWSKSRKTMTVLTGVILCINSTMGSTLTSNTYPFLQAAFHLPSDGPQSVLAASVYLIGFMFGPLIFAPLSEHYGRKPILFWGFVAFTLSTLATAVAPTWQAFLFFRFLTGTFGAPPLSIVGGVIADMFDDEAVRGRVMIVWSASTVVGPLSAPVIAGFVSPLGWRWTFWIALIIAVASFGAVFTLPETLALKLLRTRAQKLNKAVGMTQYVAPGDLNRGSLLVSLTHTLSRPLRLLCREMILSLTCVYIAFVYAIFYMIVKIFPFIFGVDGIYGFSPGMCGVLFSIMGFGNIVGCIVALWYDTIAPRIADKHPKRRPEYLRLPIACAAGPPFVASLLWLGWASSPSTHWAVPMLALVPYGLAYQMLFVAMINYIADAYDIYAASALAASATTRSIVGALIPLSTDRMLETLGVSWSFTVLAIISGILGLVPFVFIAFGPRIRAASKFSQTIHAEMTPSAAEGGNLNLVRTISAV